MRDILDDGIHGLAEQIFVLVVHGHDDKQLGLPAVQVLPERVLAPNEIVWVTCCCSVSHFGHLVAGCSIDDNVGRHSDIENEVAFLKCDFADGLLGSCVCVEEERV